MEQSVLDDEGCLAVGFRFCPMSLDISPSIAMGCLVVRLCPTGSSLPMHSWAGVFLGLVVPRRKLLLSDIRRRRLTLRSQQLH